MSWITDLQRQAGGPMAETAQMLSPNSHVFDYRRSMLGPDLRPEFRAFETKIAAFIR